MNFESKERLYISGKCCDSNLRGPIFLLIFGGYFYVTWFTCKTQQFVSIDKLECCTHIKMQKNIIKPFREARKMDRSDTM